MVILSRDRCISLFSLSCSISVKSLLNLYLGKLYSLGGWVFGEDLGMLRTITLGSCVSVQGTFVRALPDGRIAVKVGPNVYEGRPVSSAA